MTDKLFKLSEEPVTSYTVFERDQVLTSEQLNEITRYLDRQHRLSRVKLFGVGIVCGLDPEYTRLGQKCCITITRGAAVTTDGDILSYDDDMKFCHFKPFTDENAKYPYFVRNKKQIPLYELLTQEQAGKIPDAVSLCRFEETAEKGMDEMAVVLYLESYLHDPDICTGSDCDNKGLQQINNLRALLASRTDLKALTEQAGGYYFDLDDLSCRRVMFGSSATAIKDYAGLSAAYGKVIRSQLTVLKKVLPESYKVCEPLLKEVYRRDPSPAWKAKLDKLYSDVKKKEVTGIQYIYDFVKDLSAAYNEFREALFGDGALCCPGVGLFPKHVMLGTPAADDAWTEETFRHGFHESPVLNREAERLRKAQFLHMRIDRMIRSFKVPASGKPIRITPSPTGGPVGSRAIPYYYIIDSRSPLNAAWSHELTLRKKEFSIYSYNADKYSKDEQALKPLEYCIADYGFFRIEGHLGWGIEEAEAELKKLISYYNLPFRVVTLQIEDDPDLLPYKPFFGYSDLQVLHQLFRKDIKNELDNIEDFSTSVNDIIQKSTLPPKEVAEPKTSIKAISDENSKTLKNQIKGIKTKLDAPVTKFDYNGFMNEYDSALNTVAVLNKSIKGITYSSAYTPYEVFINNTKFKWLKWIGEILKKREESAKKLSLFSTFLVEHPGMEHLAGVERGGTFILVYSSLTKKVVADFALPYYCCEPAAEEEEETVTEEETPKKWTEMNDLFVFRIDEKLDSKINEFDAVVNKKYTELDAKLNQISAEVSSKYAELDLKISSEKETINQMYISGLNTLNNLVKTVVEVQGIQPSTPAGGVTMETPGFATAETGILENTVRVAREIDKRIYEGTATEEEKELRSNLDKVIARSAAEVVARIGEGPADVAEGSVEEKIIEFVRDSSALIKDDAAKKLFAAELERIKETSGEKSKFTAELGKFDVLKDQ
ncbi:MAG: hypothetical protein GXO94_09250 [Nitrospirae bacterium]|nr:hypothetical protein [Nitrospirota bacterium]